MMLAYCLSARFLMCRMVANHDPPMVTTLQPTSAKRRSFATMLLLEVLKQFPHTQPDPDPFLSDGQKAALIHVRSGVSLTAFDHTERQISSGQPNGVSWLALARGWLQTK